MDQAQHLRNIIKSQNTRSIGNTMIFTVTSGKGGVGKSNMSVNLAVQFKRLGKRVLILDADFGLANVEVMFGTVPKHNLSDVVFHGKNIRDIITEGPEGIGFISGGSGIVGLNNLTREQVNYMVSNLNLLNDLCDILIIDTGAGVSDTVMEFVLASPEIILVSTPEPSSLTDSYSLLKALYKSEKFIPDATRVHLVANKVVSDFEGKAVFDKLNQVVKNFLGGEIDYLGPVYMDSTLENCVRNQKVVSIESPSAKSSKCFENIANKLLQKECEIKPRLGISHLINSFLHK